MYEQGIIKKVLLKLGRYRLFRNQVGAAWQGKAQKLNKSILIENPRYVQFGLIEGSSDLIGWRPMEITKDMIGQTIAQFAAVEIKSKNDRITEKQLNFMKQVKGAGGVALVAREQADGEILLLEKT